MLFSMNDTEKAMFFYKYEYTTTSKLKIAITRDRKF